MRAAAPPGRPRVFLDGYNLALDQGTGVATYARNLSFAFGRLGFETGCSTAPGRRRAATR
ncbi:hypothetical protein ACFQY5_21105 [Paeniroseomonas aquatica]|uniref:hypothetical protein n=1 Tax=Paeniroseomonas aquatica TaxID=373043 RepID=UPI00361E1500